jgi:SPP1 gp7 family putative phage head morphogenesis protein
LDKEKEKEREEPEWRNRIRTGFEEMMAWLWNRQQFQIEMMESGQVRQFIDITAGVLNKAVDEGIKQVPASDIMKDRLRNSNFVFSGFKTFHELNEAFPSLLDENGNRKTFEHFLKDVQTINEKYNKWYLEAEYKFAVTSAQMAAKWEKFAGDGDRYDLQYRTADDRHVRDSHRKLADVTLPVTSKFWDYYFPPNGWGCRCNVVQVRKGKYPVSDEVQAMKDGEHATLGKHEEMFRFNPGKQYAVFPAYNPYTVKKCTSCSKSGFELAKIPDNEMCSACAVVLDMVKNKELLKEQRKEIREWAKNNLIGKTTVVEHISNPIEFTSNGIKEAINQPHRRIFAKNEAIKEIVKLLRNGEYIMEVTEKKNNPMVNSYHYVRINIAGEDSYAVIRELKNGKEQFYCIVEKIKSD